VCAVSVKLFEISKDIERLAPSHRNPEKYHEDKSEIVKELRGLAKSLERGDSALGQRTKFLRGVRCG
jgi:hypothetical protein